MVPASLRAVLLVGGSSRIPLVSEMVSNELGRPVVVMKSTVPVGTNREIQAFVGSNTATAGTGTVAIPYTFKVTGSYLFCSWLAPTSTSLRTSVPVMSAGSRSTN